MAITKKGGYQHGMAQPGVLVLKQDGSVLFNWAIQPGVVCSFFFLPISLGICASHSRAGEGDQSLVLMKCLLMCCVVLGDR